MSEKFSAASAANRMPPSAFAEAAGAHRDGLGLVFDGIHRPGEEADGVPQPVEQHLDHVGGGALQAEVKFEVGRRQPPRQIFEQQREIGAGVVAHGDGELLLAALAAEFGIELGDLLPEALFQDQFEHVHPPRGGVADGPLDALVETEEEA